MAFERILNALLLHPGVEGVIFLDSEGEAIFSFGEIDLNRLKAMGAYQGIVLTSSLRLNTGQNGTIITRCDTRTILTQQLKDGYFVCAVLEADANPAHANFVFRDYFYQLENEL